MAYFSIWFHCVAVAKAWKKPSNKSFWQRPIENEKLFAAVASVVLALKQLKPTFYFLFNFTPTGSAIIFGSKTVLQMFSQILFFAGNHGNNFEFHLCHPIIWAWFSLGWNKKKFQFLNWKLANSWNVIFSNSPIFNFSLAKLSEIDPHENDVKVVWLS